VPFLAVSAYLFRSAKSHLRISSGIFTVDINSSLVYTSTEILCKNRSEENHCVIRIWYNVCTMSSSDVESCEEGNYVYPQCCAKQCNNWNTIWNGYCIFIIYYTASRYSLSRCFTYTPEGHHSLNNVLVINKFGEAFQRSYLSYITLSILLLQKFLCGSDPSRPDLSLNLHLNYIFGIDGSSVHKHIYSSRMWFENWSI
jgi:hypothetical protein